MIMLGFNQTIGHLTIANSSSARDMMIMLGFNETIGHLTIANIGILLGT